MSERKAHASLEERRARGREAREATPLDSHAGWEVAPDRADPVGLLAAQDATREPDLVPVRHGRMMVTPFTFYRGAATVMAEDLSHTPTAGLDVQLCGDAHLSNFGIYGSPERQLVFDLNDFDETLPGPFEYDVKRLAASVVVAARNNGFSAAETDEATTGCVRAYRQAMADFAQRRTLDVWYAHLSVDDVLSVVQARAASLAEGDDHSGGKGKAKGKKGPDRKGQGGKGQGDGDDPGRTRYSPKEIEKAVARAQKLTDKARSRDSLHALTKLAEQVDGRYRIASDPPLVVPLRELFAGQGLSADEVEHAIREQFAAYRDTLADDRRLLLDRFEIVDVARKVVGVGSVGTRSFIVLLEGRDSGDPLFLQVKEATRSVLEQHLPASAYELPGERVVQGQRLMQATSDIFLGWTRGVDETRHFYWRQLRDMKGSVVIEQMIPEGLALHTRVCAWSLARAHARSGDPVAIAEYLGDSDTFDRAVTDFAHRYADRTERDHADFVAAVDGGRLEAVSGL
ncbi:MAG TPA: DUF2252 domain-containing protein [Pedococcus sp.]